MQATFSKILRVAGAPLVPFRSFYLWNAYMQSTGFRWESCISILTSALIGVMWQMLCLQARYCY